MLGSCCFSGSFRSEDTTRLTVERMDATEQADTEASAETAENGGGRSRAEATAEPATDTDSAGEPTGTPSAAATADSRRADAAADSSDTPTAPRLPTLQD